MTGMNTVVPVAQCFLSGQTEDDFLWFLQALRAMMENNQIDQPCVIHSDRELAILNSLWRVFPTVPSLICRWHLNQDVLAKARQELGQIRVDNSLPGQDKYENSWQTEVFKQCFYETVESTTEVEVESHCRDLRTLSPALASYLDLHWWKFKHKIVRCWTNTYCHFEYRDTSAVEGTHAQCNRWLQSCNGDLLTVFKRLLPWLVANVSSVSIRSARDATILPYLLQKDRYSQVARIITVWALCQTDELWKTSIKMLTGAISIQPCTGTFRVVNGRPCVHELITIVRYNGTLKLLPTAYHAHWWIYRDRQQIWRPRIQDPVNLRRKRKNARSHRSNHGASGTARDPVFAERVDLNNSARPPPQGGVAGDDLQGRMWTLPPAPNVFPSPHAPSNGLPAIQSQLEYAKTLQHSDVPPLRNQITALHREPGVQTTEQPIDQAQDSFAHPSIPPRSWGYASKRPF
jgi:hypothetical protein